MKSKVTSVGRVITARLEPGEKLLESVTNLAAEYDIQGGLVSVIGALRPAEVMFFDMVQQQYQSLLFDEMVELISATGSVSRIGKKPFIHMHIVCGRSDGTTIGGHCGPQSTISITGEVYIYETQGTMRRVKRHNTPVNLLEPDL
jgi:hypothetical protein